MLQSNNRKAYTSIMALFCSVILLNMGLAHFNYTRQMLKTSFFHSEGLSRKTFRSGLSARVWDLSEGLDRNVSYAQTVNWKTEPLSVWRAETIGDLFIIESLVIEATNHPEWGRVASKRVTSKGSCIILNGEP
ncbi:MAG: hypothetical protein CSA81_00020 [Acidobacteria bacterium]|nr:MAG: hypothetical protein CSA81_00020 [Acidobacteriota bacterium]PIE91606.1 MAG: hypothetical protein CR997_00185 [Acidobacteriota bacterium]